MASFCGAAAQSGGDEITVTATREERQRLDVPATVDVISRRQMEERQTRDIQDAVRYIPGVSVERFTSATDPWKNLGGFTVRGVSGNRVAITVDGVRIIERITDGTRDLIDIPYMRSIEIMRGPASVLWGADALGGLVAFRTMNPQDLIRGNERGWGARLHTSFDSFTRSIVKTAMAGVTISPNAEAIFSLSHGTALQPTYSTARADGGIWTCPTIRALPCNITDPFRAHNWNGFAKFVFRPADNHELRLTVEHYSKMTVATQLWDRGIVATGSWRNDNFSRDQYLERQRATLSHDWTPGWGWIDAIRTNLTYSPQRRNLDSYRYQTGVGGTNLNQQRLTYDILDYSEKFYQGDVQLTSSFNFGPSRHVFTYGFQGDVARTDYYRQGTITNLTTGTSTTTIAGGFNFANATTTRADFYIQDEIRLLDDRWTITPGLRWANYRMTPRLGAGYQPVPGAEPREVTSSRFIPQIGTIFKLTDVYSVYARYGEGFKMPTAQQLYLSVPNACGAGCSLIPNPTLQPESARSYEAGFRGRFERGWFSIGAFHTNYKNFIQSFQTAPDGVNMTNINLSSVVLWGIEGSAEYRVTDDIHVHAGFSYQFGNQRSRPTSPITAFDAASPFNGVLGLRWFKRDWNLDGEVVSRFSAPVSRASVATVYKPGGWFVLDSFVNWRPRENVTLRAGVQNIFDTRYFQNLMGSYPITPTTAVAQQNPLELQVQPGRTFKASMTVDF
ncbi:MAG: TonB-dependent receptor [Phreatobacter sp.]|uniref:TonB-dependent receptor domain-containing protein n=1 Tax=Phreatobacter sp. TaxID=1966341 RepID=UPI001A49C36F|nr:TonB-dependent receptor [Phreatobacter sp.]MBL8568240.1 TonB-dependent receptor [Phreatobacter sp.]